MKQMGHSVASLYRKASTLCPFTYGSLGSCISCGVMSDCELFFDPVASDARVLARPRKKGVEEGGEPKGEEGPG